LKDGTPASSAFNSDTDVEGVPTWSADLGVTDYSLWWFDWAIGGRALIHRHPTDQLRELKSPGLGSGVR
jgi:hypothetical protein